ncbi:Repeat domain-containing protein [Nannocystis exedens]|uniref:Repeat domain-containing protein n=1 Tax=Nannocystis exedens TaxID=54 RepID=A0A1I1XT75_9BACT|nr:FG-GAP-like repeat-containing protein [Nannocystis exedens]PCC73290.1 FG-GAP repeat protein [Nannocystis exedens]SFE09043.1 Repeat domain-containing protein [Nannocystis exedens]
MAPRRSSAPRIFGLAALGVLVGLACGGDDVCGPHAWWCDDEDEWRPRSTPIDDAVLVDFDGDGDHEAVVLSREGQKLTLARGASVRAWRTSLQLTEKPVALAALPGEVAVALTEPPQVALFGMDDDGRLVRRRDIALREEPFRLDAADLDGDGAPELLVAMREAHAIAVIDPRAGESREYPAGDDPVDIEVGDLDGDGHADVVVIDFTSEALQVLRGAGDGTLKPAVASPSAPQFYLALVDYDGDGDLDAVARNVVDETVLVQRNDGHGRFSSPTALPTPGGASGNAGLAASAASASGLASVSVARDDVLATWVGKGASWLGRVEQALPRAYWTGPGPAGELLAGARNYLGRYAWQPGFSPLQLWRSIPLPLGDGGALATGDLDGDHLLDFAAASATALHLFHGRADRGFELTTQFSLEAPATAMVIGDVSGDGRDDIVLDEGDDVRAWIAGEDGQWLIGPRASTGVPARVLVPLRAGPDAPRAIAVLPTRVQYEDVEVPGARVLRFDADGLATATAIVDDLIVDALAPVDLDADGVDEPLILGRRGDVQVLTHLAPAGDAYEPTFEHDLEDLLGISPFPTQNLAAGDLDGDGDPEVLFGHEQTRARIDGLADGAPVATIEEQPAPTHLHDLDGDGSLDVVNFVHRVLSYQRGQGDGTFAPQIFQHEFPDGVEFALASRPDGQFDLAELAGSSVASYLVREVNRPAPLGRGFNLHGAGLTLLGTDLDGDGHDDVAFQAEGGIGWSWGSETDPLTRADGVAFSGWNRGLGVGDLDGDGAAEVLTVSIIDTIHAFRVHPRLAEQPLVFAEARTGNSDLAVADLDGDGHPDVLALRLGGAIELAVAYGTAEPFTFGPWQTAVDLPLGDLATFQLGDVDGDGDLDVLFQLQEHPPVLVRNEGSRAFADPVGVLGTRARFAPVGPGARVELVTQDWPTIYRHEDGDPDRRVALVHDEDGVLLEAADADADGRYDLTVIEPEATFAWLRRDDGPARIQLVEGPLHAVAYPDVDGDGRPDLVGLVGDVLYIRRSGR